MPYSDLMTWVESQGRWTAKEPKHLGGRIRSVSPRALGIPKEKRGNKLASREAANQWWRNHLASLTPVIPPEPERDAVSTELVRVVRGHDVAEMRRFVDRADAFRKVLDMLDGASVDGVADSAEGCVPMPNPFLGRDRIEAEGLPVDVADRVLGQGFGISEEAKVEQVRKLGKALRSPTAAKEESRTVRAQVDDWKKAQADRLAAGKIADSRYSAYCREIGEFVEWIGPETDVGTINEKTLDDFFSHLGSLGNAASYNKNRFGAMRMFVDRLSNEHGTIPVPRNLRSKNHLFDVKTYDDADEDDDDDDIIFVDIAEAKRILAACNSDRQRLYFLLAFNASMTQKDMADLTQKETDWTLGTIYRRRSKRKRSKAKKVRWTLWDETFRLLTQERSTDEKLALVSGEGNPLVCYKGKRYDLVGKVMTEVMERAKVAKPPMACRKFGCNVLKEHPHFKFYQFKYQAHSPKGMTLSTYADPSDAEFALACKWVGEQIGLATSERK